MHCNTMGFTTHLQKYWNYTKINPWENHERLTFEFGVKGWKIFGLHDHAFDKKRIFLFMKGDNNYSISTAIFGYNPKLSL